MRGRESITSRALLTTVMVLVSFSVFINLFVITQAFLEPVKVIRRADDNGVVGEDDAVIPKTGDDLIVQVGDLVVFRDPSSVDGYAVYRVQGFHEDDRGLDCALVNTGSGQIQIPLRDAVGKAWLVLPKGGVILDFVRTPPGFLLCVVSPWVLLVIYLIGRHLDSRRLRTHKV